MYGPDCPRYKLKKSRDNKKVEACLERLRDEARGQTNLMPAILEAVEAYTTVGEITAALKVVFGEYPAFGG